MCVSVYVCEYVCMCECMCMSVCVCGLKHFVLQVCIGYIAQVQRSPARFVVSTVATCANMTPSLGNIGLVVPRPSQGAPVNGVLLAIVITVVIVIVIGVLVTVVLTGLVCQRNK